MAAEYFNKIADEVLLAAEQMQSLLTTGDLIPADGASNDDSGGDFGDDIGGAGGGASSSSSSGSHEFDMSDLDFDGMSEQEIQELLGEEIMQNNPLQGIADDVTKNIMAGQVRCWERERKTRIESNRIKCRPLLFVYSNDDVRYNKSSIVQRGI